MNHEGTGIGHMLVDAREARKITLEQAERDTRIVRRYLIALESEDFAAFPAEVYARGFLRSYGSYLGLNPAELLALMPRPEAEEPPSGGRRGRARPPLPPSRDEPLRSAREPERPRRDEGVPRRPGPPGRPGGEPRTPPPRPLSEPEPLPPLETSGRRPAAVATPSGRQGAGSPMVKLGLAVAGGVAVAAVIGMLAGGGGGGIGAPGSITDGQGAVATAPPQAGAPVASGRMPELRGLDEQTARERLELVGATAFVIEVPSSDAPAGQVLRQSPAAGGELKDRTVTIVISRGG
jgi:cytoskeleton protein RodZ